MKYLLMALDVAVAILSVVTIVLWIADRKNNRAVEKDMSYKMDITQG